MRPLELALAIGLVLLVVVALRHTWRRHARLVGVVVLLVGAAQVLLEGQRWQLWPAYGAAGVAGLLAAAGPAKRPASPRLLALVAGLGTLLAVVFGTVLPVPALDLRPVDRAVGTQEWVLTDADRDGRRIVVQAWYPTDDTAGRADALTSNPGGFAVAAGGWLGLPPGLLEHLGLATSQAWVDATVAAPDGGLPVVLLSHGWGGFRKAQVLLAEGLAADGHLVLSPDHTLGSLATEYPDGEVVAIDPTLLPDDVPPPVYDAASQRLERLFADDLLLTLDALATATGGTPGDVAAAADLDRLVLAGHSTGGGAAVWTCAETPACDGLVGYDPWVEPLPEEIRTNGLSVPLLSLRSGEWVGNDNDADLAVLHAASDDERRLAVPGTDHRDVTVLPLLTPLAGRIGLAGSLAPMTTQQVTLDVTRAFLAEVLGTGSGDPGVLDEPPPPVLLEPPA